MSQDSSYLKIQFKVTSKKLAKDIFNLLTDLKIGSKLYNYNGISLVYIPGKTQCKAFMEKVGFKHPAKNEKIWRFLNQITGQGVHARGNCHSSKI